MPIQKLTDAAKDALLLRSWDNLLDELAAIRRDERELTAHGGNPHKDAALVQRRALLKARTLSWAAAYSTLHPDSEDEDADAW